MAGKDSGGGGEESSMCITSTSGEKVLGVTAVDREVDCFAKMENSGLVGTLCSML